MPKFYVTATWHDFPEGGSYGNVVTADTHDEAERLLKLEMADCTAESCDYVDIDKCANCGNTDQDGSDTCIDCGCIEWVPGKTAVEQAYDDYASQWHIIDCFKIEDSPTGRLLVEILKAWDEPYYGDFEAKIDNLFPEIEKARKLLYS